MRLKLFYFPSETFPYTIKFWTKLDLTKFPYYYLANYIYLTWFVCFCNIFKAELHHFCSLHFSKFQRNKILIWIFRLIFLKTERRTFTRFNLNLEKSLAFEEVWKQEGLNYKIYISVHFVGPLIKIWDIFQMDFLWKIKLEGGMLPVSTERKL